MDLKGFNAPGFGASAIEDPREEMLRRLQEQQGKGSKGFQPSALIAEGGGLGGALAGGAAGAAIGSAVPVIGTAIGGLIGAGLGGFLGGTGGSVVEQKVRDNNVDVGKALKFGTVEGITSAGPIKLLKSGKAAYSALRAGNAVKPAVEDALSSSLLSKVTGRAGKGLETAGGKLMNSQTNLTRAQMRTIGANTPEMFMQMNGKYGLTKLDDVAEVARNVTGKDGVHSEAVRNVLYSGPGIETGDIRSAIPEILDRKASLVSPSTRKQVQTQVDNAIQSMYADQPLNPLANPGAAFDIAKDFRGQARQLRTGANPSGAEKQLSQVYDEIAGSLEKKLYSQPGIEQAFPAVRDNMVKTYQSLAQKAGGVQGRAYQRLAEEASQLNNVADLRTAQKIWVEASQVDKKTAEAAGNAATKLSGGGGLLRRAGNAALDAAGPRAGAATASTGRAVAGGGALLGRLNNTGTRAITGAGIANMPNMDLSQQGSPLSANDGQSQSPQDLMGGGIPIGQDWTPTITGKSQSQQGTPGYYLNAAQKAAAAGDMDSAKAFMGMASSVTDINSASGTKLTNNQQKGVLAMQNATSQVQQLEQLYNQAGGGQGRLGGTVSGLLGKVGVNAEAQAYRQKRAGAATLIARALGETGTMTDQDITRAVNQIPDITDTPQEAQIKWGAIRQILSQIGQNTSTLNSAPTSNSLLTQMNGY